MTAKEQARRRGGRRELRLPLVMRLSECAIRFMLAAVLAGAEILDGHAPFALAMVGAAGPGTEGLSALLGAALGYLSFQGFLSGLRYIAASMMIYAVDLALYDFAICRRVWFMPLVSAALNGLVGFVYLSAGGWTGARAAAFAAEAALAAGSVYFYRLAFSVWEERRGSEGLTIRQTVGVLALGGTILLALSRVTVGETMSVGRVLAAAVVMTAAWKGGVGVGSAVGVAAGLTMDLAAAEPGWYTLIYAFSGLVTGVFSGQSRVLAALAGIVSAGAAALWGAEGQRAAALWEAAAAGVMFLILPERMLRRLWALTRQEGAREGGETPGARAAGNLRRTAAAFRAIAAGMDGLTDRPVNDGDAARIFDRAAEKVCARCGRASACWQQEYQTTRTALGDALPRMLDRGEGLPGDFPPWFADRCLQFRPFLEAANRELEQLLLRRMYDSRVRESRAAVRAQYGQLAGILDRAAAEAAEELAVDVRRQRQVKQRLTALGLEGRCAVFQDSRRHLRLELEGRDVEALGEAEELSRLSQLMGCPLRVETRETGRLTLAQKEPYKAVAGVSALGKDGMPVSGDSGAWFRDGAGRLHLMLCDGMGSGLAARQDSDEALRLLEKLLRAGVEPEQALRTVGDALALRGETEGGFTTVDLLRVDLFTGKAAVYKMGAAPTYLRRDGKVERLCGASLPAGLMTQPEGEGVDVFPLELGAGDCVVMVSDGVSSGKEDSWLRQALEQFDGLSPRELARQLLSDSRDRAAGEDDRTVIVLKLDLRE